jgi:hypothetical protein
MCASKPTLASYQSLSDALKKSIGARTAARAKGVYVLYSSHSSSAPIGRHRSLLTSRQINTSPKRASRKIKKYASGALPSTTSLHENQGLGGVVDQTKRWTLATMVAME